MPFLISSALETLIQRKRVERPLPFPMALLRPHEAQALRNHGQTLDRLRERGGLGATEMLAILEDRPWGTIGSVAEVPALARLAQMREPA